MAKKYKYSETADNINKTSTYLAHRKRCREIASDGLISLDKVVELFAQNCEAAALRKIDKIKSDNKIKLERLKEEPSAQALKDILQPQKSYAPRKKRLSIAVTLLRDISEKEMELLQKIVHEYENKTFHNIDFLMISIKAFGNSLTHNKIGSYENPRFQRGIDRTQVKLVTEGIKKAIIHVRKQGQPTFNHSNMTTS